MTLNEAIAELVILHEHSMMPAVFKPSIQKIIETVSEYEEPSADADLEGYSDNRWKAAYERGKRHGITTCGECVHLHDNDCPMLWGRQLDDFCSWAEREGEDATD